MNPRSDLADITVDPDNSSLTVELAAGFSTSFGMILASSTTEEIIVLGESCGGDTAKGFVCNRTLAAKYELDYTDGGTKGTNLIVISKALHL